MNEKIKKIAEKANAWFPMGYPSAEGGDAAWENLVIFEKEDLQKFAELIIKECSELCLTSNVSNLDLELIRKSGKFTVQDLATRSCGENLSVNIKKHFGVE